MISVHLGFSSCAQAQGEDGTPPAVVSRAIAATVDYGNDAVFQPEKCVTEFSLLGIRPEQPVTISVQFPVELAGQPVAAEVLDGGTLTLPEGGLIIGDDGMVTFQFQASIIGACRIEVHQPDDANFIRFWVVDLEYPENNPADLPGAY